MSTKETLVNRLNDLMEKETSGIVARFEDDTVVTWIHTLKTLFARQEWGDSYLACDSAADAEIFLSGFAGQLCQCSISELGDAEQQYLSDCLWSLLWDMVHEEPEIDCEIDFDRFQLCPSRATRYGPSCASACCTDTMPWCSAPSAAGPFIIPPRRWPPSSTKYSRNPNSRTVSVW